MKKLFNLFIHIPIISSALFVITSATNVYANNLSISNVSITGQDIVEDTFIVEFDIAWDNSWLDDTNHDAVWLFIKVADSTSTPYDWTPLNMQWEGTDPEGTSAGSDTNLEVHVSHDKFGAFIRRKANGTGNISSKDVQLEVSYSGVFIDTSDLLARVYGIEMVYVPQGAFYAGDAKELYIFQQGAADTDPWYIDDEEPIRMDGTSYYFTASPIGAPQYATGADFTIPAAFPKGYKAYYAMKYELTEGQWVGFFNSLSAVEKGGRDITGYNATWGGKNSDSVINRNTVSWNGVQDATTARPDRAMNYINWQDLLAYLDWAGLRPMTELEYEKLARGPLTPVIYEYAWGNSAGAHGLNFSISPEDGTEEFTGNVHTTCCLGTYTQGDAFLGAAANYAQGPARVGIFASDSTSRFDGGAGYYGAMELTGNVYEMVVTVGNTHAVDTYTGLEGDGSLSSNTSYEGNAHETGWPGMDSTAGRGVTGNVGHGHRGADWFSTVINDLHVSYRGWTAWRNTREVSSGGRGVRTED